MTATTRRLGLSPLAIVGLALLGVPRVVVHDLGSPSAALSAVLTIGPVAVWVFVVLRARAPRPMLTLIAIGLVFGLLLGVTHQILWEHAYDEPPRLGDNLSDLPDWAHAVITRSAGFVSSLFTGLLLGVLGGACALAIRRLAPGARPA